MLEHKEPKIFHRMNEIEDLFEENLLQDLYSI
jgi:hypothetical protein